MKEIQLSRKQIKQRKIKDINYYYAVITHHKVKKTLYGRTIKELQEKYKSWVKEEETITSNTDTVLNHYTAFLKQKEGTIKETSFNSYKNLYKHIKENRKLANIRLNRLSETDIYSFIQKLNLKFSSKCMYLNLFKVFLEFYVRRGVLTKNVARDVIINDFSVKESRNRYVNKEIRAKILNDIKGTEIEISIRLMLECGLRLGEAVCICRNDLIEPNKIYINKSRVDIKKDNKLMKVTTTTKNSFSNRVIIVPTKLYNLIKHTKRPYPYYRHTIYYFLKNNYNITPHDLRHTFITDAVEQGVNINVLKKYVGHSLSSRTLEKTYLHIQDDFITQELNKIFK